MRYVLDASAVIDALIRRDLSAYAAAEPQYFEPSVMPYEVADVLRKLEVTERYGRQRYDDAFEQLMRFPATYWPWEAVADRVWELRHNVTSTDASYVAVAEATGGTLLTRDRRLAAAPGIRCPIEVVS